MIQLPDSFSPVFRTLRHALKPVCLPVVGILSLMTSGCEQTSKEIVDKPIDPNAYKTVASSDKIDFFIWETRILYKEDVIEMTVGMQVVNKTDKPLNVRKEGLQLLDEQGRQIPEYYQAFAPEFVIQPGEKGYAQFKCRPTLENLAGPITVVVHTARKVVKDRNPLEESDLPSNLGAQKAFIAANWKEASSVRLLSEKEEEMNYKFKVEEPTEQPK